MKKRRKKIRVYKSSGNVFVDIGLPANYMEKKYKKAPWAVQQVVRASGVVEDICSHGVGHPNQEWVKENDAKGERALGIHGCDGCCCGILKGGKK